MEPLPLWSNAADRDATDCKMSVHVVVSTIIVRLQETSESERCAVLIAIRGFATSRLPALLGESAASHMDQWPGEWTRRFELCRSMIPSAKKRDFESASEGEPYRFAR